MKAKTIVLETPIEYGGKQYAQIDLREPTFGEDRKARTQPNDDLYLAQLASFVSGVPLPAFDELPASKMAEVAQTLMGFMSPGPETGGN